MDTPAFQAKEMNSSATPLSILNPNPIRIQGPSLLHELVRGSSPDDAPAIDYLASDGTRQAVTYAELHRRSGRLAQRILAALPQEHEQQQLVVPVLLPQCPELYISQLAILKVGGAFCPLNLEAPPERVKFIFDDVSATVVLTSTNLQSKIPSTELNVIVILVDADEDVEKDETGHELATSIKPEKLAYVMYTSGSTGTPKGVGISHDAASQALLAHDRHIPMFSRFLQFAAPTFDVSVFEIFFPLFRGTTLVSCSRADMLNDLPAVLRGLDVDACELTPTVAGSLLRSRDNAPGLRLLLTIGEMLTEPVIREFGGSADRSSILWAMYGPTEATIHCTLQPACNADSPNTNVGFPLDTVSAFILEPVGDDGSGEVRVLPLGEKGELAVGGHQTSVGYINRPEQTANVFIDTPHGRLYRTGDKARIRNDGTIECFGRISDGQVKLRGQRIELGEIEQAVLRTPSCHGAVASVAQGIIVVFVDVDDPNNGPDIITHMCREWLPDFMVPGDIVMMKGFPRLPSGKVDRKGLKAGYEKSRNSDSARSAEYHDEVEHKLAQLAEESLGFRLDRFSSLSALGMDSLMAIKFASQLRRAGFDVGAVDILSSKTLSNLRMRVRRGEGRRKIDEPLQLCESAFEDLDFGEQELSRANAALGDQISAIDSIVPCAPMQVSMLAETLSNPEAYCNWIELKVPASFGADDIISWFRNLAQLNESLRTGFVVVRGQFRQIIWRQLESSQIRSVKRLSKNKYFDEQALLRPFTVQILPGKMRRGTQVLVQLHHALYDGWSFDMVMSDLDRLARGQQLVNRPQFRLVSGYYQSANFLASANVARSYWAEYLLGFQPTAIPQLLAKHTSSGQIFSAQRTLNVNTAALEAISKLLDGSIQVVFQACLLWLWGSILGTDDVVIGTVTSGRTLPIQGIEDVMGPCLTTIPLRSKMGHVRTIRELLESIHAGNRESLAHCTLPLADIKKSAGIMPGQRLYDALFVYQESIHSRGRQPEIVQQVAHEDYLETKLLAEVEPLERGYQLRIMYHADVIHYVHAQMLLKQFESVLSHIIVNYDSEITSIGDCFSDKDLSQYNRSPKTFRGCPDLAKPFEAMALRAPEKTAICFAESINENRMVSQTISYSKLNILSNRIARHLQASGASEDGTVAIIMEKSIMLYAGILGILKAGCAYLPLLPSTPLSRVETILKQAEVRLCILDDTSQDNLGQLDCCQFVDLDSSKLDEYSEQNIDIQANPARIANIIYTSGSTGVPKGVCVTQLNITSNLDVLSRIYPFKEDSRILQSCSQAFDVSVFEILFALTQGMCLCSATNDTLFADLERSIRALKVTHLSMTPTVASLVDPENVPKVEFLVTSGEPMTSKVARKWVGKLYQGYGPSETTNICSVKKMTQTDHIRHLGYTFENTSAFVLALDGKNVLPIGCVGEFCFGGDQVVAGYLNLPDITRDKFIDHPKLGRLYRSGDVGRMLADGSLIIVGRVDDQIKLRGQRIELGEINAAVAASGEVDHCVTILVNHGDDSTQQLACFYVPKSMSISTFSVLSVEGSAVRGNASIFHTLRSRLPGYMVPSYLISISTIPMTSSGKVDKLRLRSTFKELGPAELEFFTAQSDGQDDDGDWTTKERQVATLVAKVLGIPLHDIGRWTPFTSFGLDSISAISVAKELYRYFSRRVPISAILQNPSVAMLSPFLSASQTGPTSSVNALAVFRPGFLEQLNKNIEREGLFVEKILPCTPLQEAMLSSSANDASYLNKILFHLKIDPDEMKQHWSTMFQRHGTLRTCFFSTDNREHAIAQVVLKAWEPAWLSLDARDSSVDQAILKHAASVPAAIDCPTPPISLAIISDHGDSYLSFVCHHALYDGVAVSRLLLEIEQTAEGVELVPAPSYEPFLTEMLSLPESTDEFWKEHLQGLKPAALPRTPDPSVGRDTFTRALDIPLTSIEGQLKTLNISLLSLAQASWSSVLRIILRSGDVCFGNVVNGRSGTVDRVDELVAPCFNTIPTRIDFQDTRRSIDVMKLFQSLNPEILQYQFTPLRRIQTLCSTNGAHLFDALLLLQQPLRELDESLWILERDEGEMNFPLVCEITPIQAMNRLEVKLHFDCSYISTEFASFIYDTLSHILASLLQFPSSHTPNFESLPKSLHERLEGFRLVHTSSIIEDASSNTSESKEWSDSERFVRFVFSKISGVQENNITQDMTIFRLGLDSINAVQVAAMLRKEGFDINATNVLENPTCAKLAAKLSSHQQSGEKSVKYDLEGFQNTTRFALENNVSEWGSVETVLPCTPLQMGMLTEFVNSKGKNYFNFITYRVDENISTASLRQAWLNVVEAHPMLRTGFTPIEHKDASFVMLQYAFSEQTAPLSIESAARFNIPKWQLDAAHDAYTNLHQPPWRVTLVEDSTCVTMQLAIHHVIYDAHSLQVLLDDLSKSLRGESLHSSSSLDAAVQDIITESVMRKEDAKPFWEKQASRAVINNFPIMTPLREENRKILVKSKNSALPFSALEEAVKRAGFAIQAVAQAAWLRILSSYLGESSVVFGVILSGRNTDAMCDVVLPCITTLPVIAQNSASNRTLLDSMMEYNTGLQRNQRTPLTDVQRWLGHPNTKLFDTIVVYQKFDHDDEPQKPWHVVDEQVTVDYPVSLEIEPSHGVVKLRVTFFDDVLPAEQAELLLEQFDAAFCHLAQDPDGNEDDLLEKKPKLFAVFPAEEPELPSDVVFLHQFVELSAEKSPDKTALEFVTGFNNDKPMSHKWSYKELNANGNRIANILAAHVQTGDIVAVCFDKSPEAHFAMLGILKAGCALLALDPGAPASRKQFILEDSDAAVLLADKPRSLNMDFKTHVPVIVVDEAALHSADAATPNLTRPLTPEDRSYCLYTSGTTGTPKGCEITHENAVQAMLAFQKLFTGHWGHDSKWLQFASYHFDVSVLEQYWTWSVGISLVAAPRDLILEDLAGTISRLEITHIDLTPSLARLIYPDDVPSLCRGVFITGGEQLKQEILDFWGPKGVIYNFYGPTEATIGVTTYPCVPVNGRSSNIGRQFANVGSYVLRPGTETPVLRGGVGELCVSGKLVGKGYLNRDELTTERFPTLRSFNERVYRTGDLIRVLHDGCFDFLGRADDQVKLRGQRLEIGEINHCIKSGVADVTDVATLVIRKEKQQKDLLVSFVVTAQDESREALKVITGSEASGISQRVQQACRDKLPGYMVPTYVLLLPFIPLSPNNKAEVKDLRQLFNDINPEQLVAPFSVSMAELGDIGNKICKALRTISGVGENQTTPATNIFELGVDSISVIRFAGALKREGIKQASPAVILRNPTIGDLATALQAQKSPESSSGVLEARQVVGACQHRHRGFVCRTLSVTAEQIEYIAPCSALQHGIISRSKTEGNEGLYFNTFRFELTKEVSLPKLRSAWEKLFEENSVLRTSFMQTTEGFIQVALKDSALPWDETSTHDSDNLEALLMSRGQAWIDGNSEKIDRPLELTVVDTGRIKLLVVHIFHGIYDANSLDLMLDSVAASYHENESASVVEIPSFFDALVHGPLRNHASSKQFWVDHFKGATLEPMPQLTGSPSTDDLSITRRLPFEHLDKLGKTLGVTQQAIVQAIWNSTLQRYFSSGVTFGIIVSGRSIELENVDSTIGPLFNTIPYHHHYNDDETWSSSIRRCHEFNTSILPFQHVPLRDVQKWCTGGKAIFDILFSFQRGPVTSDSGPKLWSEVESDVNADYPLALEATLMPDGTLQASLVAQNGVADEAVLLELLDDFEQLAKAAVEDPNGLASRSSSSGSAPRSSVVNGIARMPRHDDGTASEMSPDFEWSTQAQIIRAEIAVLSDVDAASVTEQTSLLELGLDSIDSIKLSARLRREGIYLSNSELVRGQNIASFLAFLRDKQLKDGVPYDSGYSSDLEDLSTPLRSYLMQAGHDLANVEEVLPPTPLQDSMVSEMLQSDFQRYFNHDILKLSPDVDVNLLKDAWTSVIAKSPILRTVFVEVDSPEFDYVYAQIILKAQPPAFCDFEAESQNDFSAATEHARVRAQDGLGQSGLLQLTFVKLQAQTYLVLSIAHALYDGWSLGLLHQDVEAAYNGTYAAREPYTKYLGQMLQSSKAGAREFWSDYVSGAVSTAFPSRRGATTESVVHRTYAASFTSAAILKAFCKRHAVSQQAVAQACWAAVLATHCKRLDVAFGVVLSGRETGASEAIMFPTMDTVLVRAVFYGSVSTFLRYMQDDMTSISQFQQFPLRKIHSLVQDRQASLFNTLFILQKSIGTSAARTEKPLMTSIQGSSAVEYPVCVEMEIVDDSVIWRTACDDDYLTSEGTSRLLHELDVALSFMINSSDAEVLKFQDDDVSVCGLPTFQVKGKSAVNGHAGSKSTDEEGVTWSPTEHTIRQVLAEMSEVEEASILKSHNLFNLGLDSISAIKVSLALRKRGVVVSVRDMMKASSIKDMAKNTANNAENASGRTLEQTSDVLKAVLREFNIDELLSSAGINAAEVEETLPATPMQTHMLSVWENTGGTVFYPEFYYRSSGVSDCKVIYSAWKALTDEYSILRTCFVASGSRSVPFFQVTLRNNDQAEFPLVSLTVQQDGAGNGDGCMLKLKIHHALYDGISLPMIMDRFGQLLRPVTATNLDKSQSLPVWKHFVASQFKDNRAASRKSFWMKYLDGATSTSLPAEDAPGSAYSGFYWPFSAGFAILQNILSFYYGTTAIKNDQRVSHLNRAALTDTAHLKTLCHEHRFSIQAVFLAAYAQALASMSGSNDVVFGIYLANRSADDQDVARLAYPTLCLVPLRVRVQQDPDLIDVAREIQHDLHQISSPENVSVGLWEIKEWTGIKIDSFVNFLSLPGDLRGDQNVLESGIQLEKVSYEEAIANGDGSKFLDPSQVPWLEKNLVKDAYPDTVDIEASVQANGALDIGVFGSREKLGQDESESLVKAVVDILRKV